MMDLDRALAFSRYADRALIVAPSLRVELEATLDAPFDWMDSAAALDQRVADGNAPALAETLRSLRRRVFLHTLARDLTGRATLVEVVQTISTLAERALRAAITVHAQVLAGVHGLPIGEETGSPQQLIVIAMGKLGGGELNVSSDIDLVFVYPEEGETDGAQSISNREFFDRLGRRLIAAISHVDADGYVFRVDMRLRPYGDSGPLTASFAALEQYLVTQGRAWERYAWLKARPLTGGRHDELAALITPFVYRKYLDYDAYEGLRGIHRQIREQEKRKDTRRTSSSAPAASGKSSSSCRRCRSCAAAASRRCRFAERCPRCERWRAHGPLRRMQRRVLRDGYVFLRDARAPVAVSRRPANADRALRCGRASVARRGDGISARATRSMRACASIADDIARQFNAVFDAPATDADRHRGATIGTARCGTTRRPQPETLA